MTATIHCPYCNADIPITKHQSSNNYMECPICGDSFPVHAFRIDDPHSSILSRSPMGQESQSPKLTNKSIARWILLGMLFMAIVGLVFALRTVPFRRQNDSSKNKLPTTAKAAQVEIVAPVDLAALGYLPADSCLVVGFHLAEMLADPNGRKLIERMGGRLGIEQLQRWTGLKQDDIDHFAVGIRPDDVFNGFTTVIRTRRPNLSSTLSKALGDAKPTMLDGKPVYRLQQSNPKRMYWIVDEQTLVLQIHVAAVELKDLGVIPKKPAVGAAALAKPIQDLLATKMNAETVLWTAGDLTKIKGLQGILFLLPQVPAPVKSLATDVNVFGAGVRFYKGVTLNAEFHGKDKVAAARLHKAFQQITPKKVELSVFGPLDKAISPGKLKDPNWVSVQMRMSMERAMTALVQPRGLFRKK